LRPLRLLTFSTLYPNAAQPNHGVFVENRLRHLVASGRVVSTVLAPVPYFPKARALKGIAARFGWQDYAAAPMRETRHGLAVHHPRYKVIPRIGMNLAPALLYRAAARALRRMIADGFEFDAIDAHYFYPDGVAAVRLGQEFGKPVVITARGSDITQLAHFPGPRRMIRDAIRRADAMISVSAALGAALVELGASPERVHVLRNGIDTQMFRPADRVLSRGVLGVSGHVLVSVGALIERKGHDRTIAALPHLPGYSLIIAGQGPEREALLALAQRLGVGDRVRLLGAIPHPLLPELFSAADASVLSSSREGWANVLLESMACGTPVVASNIPGNPEVVQEPTAGLVVDDNTPEGIAAGILKLFADLPDRAATRAYAERFSWDETTQGQVTLFERLVGLPQES
jgi:teichuronic acid biosynthesis glycosyltransferase TuaC